MEGKEPESIEQPQNQQNEQNSTVTANASGETYGKCDFYLIFDADSELTKDINKTITDAAVAAAESSNGGTVLTFTSDNEYKLVALQYNSDPKEAIKVTAIDSPNKDKIKEYFSNINNDTIQKDHITTKLRTCISQKKGGNRFAKTIRSKNITHWRRNKSNRNRRENKRI